MDARHHEESLCGVSGQTEAPPMYLEATSSDAHLQTTQVDDNKHERYQQDHSSSSEDSDSSESLDDEEDEAFLNQALEFTNHRASPSAANRHLPKPVVVPQAAKGTGLPFSRAYSPCLSERDVSEEEFLEFIDNLNVVSTTSPPLQLLDAAGGVVAMVPHHITMIVGNAVSLASKVGTKAVSKVGTVVYMKRANKDFFAPRGLKASIVSATELKTKLRINYATPLVADLVDSQGLSVVERRMQGLSEHAAPMTFDVPPPNEQTNILKRMHAGKVQKQLAKTERKAIKRRNKAERKALRASEREGAKKAKRERKAEKKDREIKAAEKVSWLLVDDL